jgi:hypothetical protein
VIDDLQGWLALEHEAVWLYGLIGGRFESLREHARDSWDAHRDTRDRLAELVKAGGGTPVGPAMGYGKPAASPAEARAAAQGIEHRIAQASVTVAGARRHRRFAVAKLRESARAAVAWGAQPEAFPGLS